jgi:hypothetical protein
MRKHLVWVLGLAVALGASSIAIGANQHTVDATVAPAKQHKFRYGKASFDFTTASDCTEGPNCRLTPANRVRIFIDDDLKINTRGLARCNPNRIQNTTTAQARRICRAAMVGTGSSTAYIGGFKQGAVQGNGTTFNGPPRGGKPTLIVHNRVDAVDSTVVLTGVFKRARGDYGLVLDVSVPPLPGGTALAKFQTKIQKTFRFRGKRRHYVSARCNDRNRTWNFKGIDNYAPGGGPPLSATTTQRCQVRR